MSKSVLEETRKHKQLCWDCEKACGRCSWSKNFTPVPGWKAIPTKIQADNHSKYTHVDSFDIYECPEFELMEEIKRRIANGRKIAEKQYSKKPEDDVVEKIKRLRIEGHHTFREIAEIVGYDERTVYRIFKKIKAEMDRNYGVVLCKECKFYQMGGCLNKEVTERWTPRREDSFCSEGKRRDQDE